ncbi:Crossover junction endonuclease EME1B [Linum perenne]
MAENPIILSDEDTDDPVTPMLPLSKRLRATRAELGLDPPPTIFLIDDDPTPLKPTSNHSSTPSFVPETPMSDVAAVKCTVDVSSPGIRVTDYGRTVVSDGGAVHLEKELFDSAGCSGGAVHLEKQRFDSAGCSGGGNWRENETVEIGDDDDENEVEWRSRFSAPVDSLDDRTLVFSVHSCVCVMKGDGGAICLETHRFSSAGCSGSGNRPENETLEIRDDDDDDNEVDWRSKFSAPDDSLGGPNLSQMSGTNSLSFEDDQPYDNYQKENLSWEQMCGIAKQKTITNSNSEENNSQTEKAIGKKRMTKEERTRVMEEKKRKKEASFSDNLFQLLTEEKLQKAALKAQEAEQKKIDRELLKWSNGKLAPKSIVAQLDNKVVEQGGIGGYLLSRFAEKGLTYRIASHPIERSILWSMTVPENLAQLVYALLQLSVQAPDVQYVLFIYEAEEFCNLVTSGSLISHISKVRSKYPSYTICYLTNKLMAYIKRREQEQYKNPGSSANAWKPPPIDEMLAKLTTHYDKSESLFLYKCRKELTRLSVNANGSTIPKDFIDKDLIKKSPWLKALVVIPKVQPRFAVAIWKKYPTMKSLLRVYMDPNKSVHEKEFMLANLPVEKVLGGESRIGEICSKRVYRILMAESGSIITEDVENGADFFQRRAP